MVIVTPRPLYPSENKPAPIVQEAEWAPGSVSYRTGLVSIPGESHWEFWWTKWYCNRFCPVRCCFVIIIPLVLLTLLHHNTTFTRRTSGRSLGTFKQSSVLSNVREHWTQECFHIVYFFFYFCVLRKPKRIHRSSSHYHSFFTFPFFRQT